MNYHRIQTTYIVAANIFLQCWKQNIKTMFQAVKLGEKSSPSTKLPSETEAQIATLSDQLKCHRVSA